MVDLQAIADRYMQTNYDAAERERLGLRGLPSLASAISSAALCRRPDGRRNSHQRRIRHIALQEGERRLLAAEEALANSGDFESLYGVIACEVGLVWGIGPLTTYDIAAGIGAYLGWEPQRVYLHAGAEVGAGAIGIRRGRARSVALGAFPPELQRLGAYHLENLLCIFKAELAGAPLSAERTRVCADARPDHPCGTTRRQRMSASTC